MFEHVNPEACATCIVVVVPAPSKNPRPPARTPRGGGRGAPRRATHSLEQILSTAIEILDQDGTKGLTLRRLAAELGGGLGSVYWYVDGKDEVLSLACDALVGTALESAGEPALREGPALETDDPVIVAAVGQVRRTAIALFEQTQLHPWLAPQMHAQGLFTPNSMRYWEGLGRPLAAMGLTPRQQFHGSTAISGYTTGVAADMSTQDIHADPSRPKDEQLNEIASEWLATDPDEFSWIHSIADEFRNHDDHDQFAAGLDLLLGGIIRQAIDRRSDQTRTAS